MAFVDTQALPMIERLLGWRGRYFGRAMVVDYPLRKAPSQVKP